MAAVLRPADETRLRYRGLLPKHALSASVSWEVERSCARQSHAPSTQCLYRVQLDSYKTIQQLLDKCRQHANEYLATVVDLLTRVRIFLRRTLILRRIRPRGPGKKRTRATAALILQTRRIREKELSPLKQKSLPEAEKRKSPPPERRTRMRAGARTRKQPEV